MRAFGLRLGSGFLSEPNEKEGEAKDGPTHLPQGVGDFPCPHPPRETLDLPTANHGSGLDLVHDSSPPKGRKNDVQYIFYSITLFYKSQWLKIHYFKTYFGYFRNQKTHVWRGAFDKSSSILFRSLCFWYLKPAI